MKLTSSLAIIICCLLLQFSNIAQKRYLFSFKYSFGNIHLVCFQGLMFLVYPLLGHLADVYITRYRTMKCGLTILIAGETLEILGVVIYTTTSHRTLEIVLTTIGAVLAVIGTGLFEANAIQFGLDQLLEAPTPKLIAFIHWYYWSQNIGGLLLSYAYYAEEFCPCVSGDMYNNGNIHQQKTHTKHHLEGLGALAQLLLVHYNINTTPLLY